MSFSQHLEIETYNNIIHKVCLFGWWDESNLHRSAPDCALSLSQSAQVRPGKGGGEEGIEINQQMYLNSLSGMFLMFYHTAILLLV